MCVCPYRDTGLVTKEEHTSFLINNAFFFLPLKYSLSADRQYLLLQRGASAIFRHSSIGEYVVIPVGAKNKMNEITLGPGRDRTNNAKRMRYNYDDDDGDFLVKHASFAPTGNALAYVGEDNNIYYRKSVMDQVRKISFFSSSRMY